MLTPSPRARVYEHGDALVLLGPDGVALELSGDTARLARAVLDFVTVPREHAELLAHLETLVGGPVEPASVVDELVDVLRRAGALGMGGVAAPRVALVSRKLVLAVSGAVAAIRAPELASRLLGRGFEIEVAMTRDARRFVTPLGLEAVTHRRVHRSLWQRGERVVPHIQLAEWAELVLVYPASATTIARIARGDCSELVSAIAIATRAPVVIVPSMNALMGNAVSVRRNLEQLREDGHHLVVPGYGVEAARAPGERKIVAGPSASLDAVVDIARFVSDEHAREVRVLDRRTRQAHWQAAYASTPLDQLPWFADELDPDLVATLTRIGLAHGRVLDLGTGAGTTAIELARRGFTVTAVDLADAAIAAARTRDGADAVTWRVDDVLDLDEPPSALVVDRGCLHFVPDTRLAEYAAAITRLTEKGGHLFVKTSRAFTPLRIAQLFGAELDLVFSSPSRFVARGGEEPALVCVLQRR